jgi:hypothetical protein
MANIQSILALGAMIILSLVSLLFNSSALQSTNIELQDKVYLTAFSLADDLIEEMKQKAFDERTVDFQAINLNQLSSHLGPDTTGGTVEVWPDFNDIDDYNGYLKVTDLPLAQGYRVTCNVTYCDAAGDIRSSQQYYKKVNVTVTNPYLNDQFYMSFIFSLHSKN